MQSWDFCIWSATTFSNRWTRTTTPNYRNENGPCANISPGIRINHSKALYSQCILQCIKGWDSFRLNFRCQNICKSRKRWMARLIHFPFHEVRQSVVVDDRDYEYLFHNIMIKPHKRQYIPITHLLDPADPVENKTRHPYTTKKP